MRDINFLPSETKVVFFKLRLMFNPVSILYYFGLECDIQIEKDASSDVISGILSQVCPDCHFFESNTESTK